MYRFELRGPDAPKRDCTYNIITQKYPVPPHPGSQNIILINKIVKHTLCRKTRFRESGISLKRHMIGSQPSAIETFSIQLYCFETKTDPQYMKTSAKKVPTLTHEIIDGWIASSAFLYIGYVRFLHTYIGWLSAM